MQPHLDFTPTLRPRFDGATYDDAQDHARLSTALHRILGLLLDGQPHTLREIADAGGCSEAGASARCRDLRKLKFGSFDVRSERQSGGLWTYRLVTSHD